MIPKVHGKIFDFYLKSNEKSSLFRCNFEAKDIKTNNAFINDVCAAWAQFNFKQPLDYYNNQILWNNSYIKVNNKLIFYKHLFQKDVTYVKDIFDDDNQIHSYNSFVRKFGILFCPFTIYYGIIKAVPGFWKQSITEGVTMPIDSGYRENLIAVSSMSRIVYKQIVTKLYSAPPVVQNGIIASQN